MTKMFKCRNLYLKFHRKQYKKISRKKRILLFNDFNNNLALPTYIYIHPKTVFLHIFIEFKAKHCSWVLYKYVRVSVIGFGQLLYTRLQATISGRLVWQSWYWDQEEEDGDGPPSPSAPSRELLSDTEDDKKEEADNDGEEADNDGEGGDEDGDDGEDAAVEEAGVEDVEAAGEDEGGGDAATVLSMVPVN